MTRDKREKKSSNFHNYATKRTVKIIRRAVLIHKWPESSFGKKENKKYFILPVFHSQDHLLLEKFFIYQKYI